jgi:hypothetical protein
VELLEQLGDAQPATDGCDGERRFAFQERFDPVRERHPSFLLVVKLGVLAPVDGIIVTLPRGEMHSRRDQQESVFEPELPVENDMLSEVSVELTIVPHPLEFDVQHRSSEVPLWCKCENFLLVGSTPRYEIPKRCLLAGLF